MLIIEASNWTESCVCDHFDLCVLLARKRRVDGIRDRDVNHVEGSPARIDHSPLQYRHFIVHDDGVVCGECSGGWFGLFGLWGF